jgi:hypothetical protein
MNALASISGTLSGPTSGSGASANQVRIIHNTNPPAPTKVAEVHAGDAPANFTNVAFDGTNDKQFQFAKHLDSGNVNGTGSLTNNDTAAVSLVHKNRGGTVLSTLATVAAGASPATFSYNMADDGDFLAIVAA